MRYPETRSGDHADVYHGVAIPDPYRWLEDPDSEETRRWVEAQNACTFAFLKQIPSRERLRQRLTKLWNYERYGVPAVRGGRYFFTRNDGLQNQSVLYTADSLDAEPKPLLDPNLLSNDGTVSLADFEISDDGRLMAYSLSTSGSDWREWRVRDVTTGRDLEDQLRWVKFSSASWTPDGQGFFYSRYDEPKDANALVGANYFQKLYYHRLGTPQADDVLVYARPDQKEWGFGGHVTDDGRYLVIDVWRGSERKNGVFYKQLDEPGATVVELLNEFDAAYEFVGNDGSKFWFRTDAGAPRGRVIEIDLMAPERKSWRDVIAATEHTLDEVDFVGRKFIASYLQDAHTQVKVYDAHGKLEREIPLPGLGSANGFRGRDDDRETFFSFTSFTTPATIYRYDIEQGQSGVFREPKVEFHASDYETRQVFYTSRDGTRVPMFITHRKGLKLDGANPTLLFGYGGFDIPITPSFSVMNLVWLELGGVYAVANLRGGGEYGRAWHEAGMLDQKQNVFNDFLAAAEWLIENRYTNSQRLAISGRSNGGLLVGACMTQRPELFAAALPAVGVMDMLRFHRFTIGWAWVGEYGSADNAEQFQALRAYSPLHNIRPGTKYPATLITTADHDDRVVPAHSYKFAAALQAAQSGDAPTLIRIETRAGHGAGKPTSKLIDEAADCLAFLTSALGISQE
jgi:prolyl oligopeptidase